MNYPWRKKKNHSELDSSDAPRNPARKNAFRRPFCPVTCNLPTRMPKEIFTRLCNTNRNSDDENYCNQVCRGKRLPDGLSFIETITFINEDQAMPQYKPGKCSLCGKQKNVITILNKSTCSTCSPVQTAARNVPELLIKALLEEQRQEWVDQHFVTEFQQSAAMSESIATLRAELVAIKDRNFQFHTKLADALGLSDAYDVDVILDAVSYLRGQVEEQQQNITGLKVALENERLKAEEQAATTYTSEIGQVVTRDSCLLDIALAVLDGNVTGLDANRLRALR
jgi:hypothetical protein